MFNADQAIADLDAMLAAVGEDVVLRRMSGATVAASVTVRAFVKESGSDGLAGNTVQGKVELIMSPTQIIAAGWTAGQVSGDDDRVPTKDNRIVRLGRVLTVQSGFGKTIGGQLVRIEVKATG